MTKRTRTTWAVVVLGLWLWVGLPQGPAAAASSASLPATVSADSLPTVQINGVANAQVVAGNTVYVTGSFSSARPAGSAVGTNETPRSNLLAYDVTTGDLVARWAPSLNGTGSTITVSPDGTRVYVGGSFTTVNGVTRNRIAALDATTGALVTSWAPGTDSRVNAVVAVGDTVYAGGIFASANGVARSRLAAFSATTGALLPWAPTSNAEVRAMVSPSSTGQVVVAGRFDTLNGTTARGSGALDAKTGATLPWAVQSQVYDVGPNAAIYSLSTDGVAVYGTGYHYGGTGNLENSFAAEAAGGTLRWVNSCLGDTYSSTPIGGVLYTAGHAHDCQAIANGKPDGSPRSYQYTQATTTAALGDTNGPNAYGWSTNGLPAPTLLGWDPTFTIGSVTGQSQAVWTLASSSRYLVAGGEFPTVNGVAQQGLARFAVRSVAPNAQGPLDVAKIVPTAVRDAGTNLVSVPTSWDRDDWTLTYELLRGAGAKAPVVATTTATSQWWNRPGITLSDPGAPAGDLTYRVRVSDSSGNSAVSPASTKVTNLGAYAHAVRASGASDYWRLDEPSGTLGYDLAGASTLRIDPSAQRSVAGALLDGDTATAFPGTAAAPATTTVAGGSPATVSIEAWFKSTTTAGGAIVGFGTSATGTSSSDDRVIFMRNDGRVVFGVSNGSVQTLVSPRPANDGAWHHVVATLGNGNGALYIDGASVASRTGGFSALAYRGVWRIGGDNLAGWPDRPSSQSMAGAVDEVAIYPTVLPASTVADHYSLAGGTATQPPTTGSTQAARDTFGRTVAAGLGSADLGGAWTLRSAPANYSVAPGAASFVSASPGTTTAAQLGSVSATGTDTETVVSLSRQPTGGGTYLTVVGRRVGSSEYRLNTRVAPSGAVTVSLVRASGGTETSLASRDTGITLAAGQKVHLRLAVSGTVSGTGTTSLTGSAWLDTAIPPASPQVTATDTAADLQAAGSVGLGVYQSSSATNSPMTAVFSSLVVTGI